MLLDPARATRRARLSLEILEDRAVPAVFVVTVNSDISEPGTLRSCVIAADEDAALGQSDTIVFAASLVGQAIHVFPSLELSAGVPITIDGRGEVTLDVFETGFAVDSNAQVFLNGLSFVDGRGGTPNGSDIGAIYNAGTLTVSNCNFRNNSGSFGGAVNSSGTLVMDNCTFQNNSSDVAGGAIYNEGSLGLTDCRFTNNTATGDNGGAIWNDGQMAVSNCSFTSNSSINYGGAIYSDNDHQKNPPNRHD
jgi:predicted outer membrane repeat protein